MVLPQGSLLIPCSCVVEMVDLLFVFLNFSIKVPHKVNQRELGLIVFTFQLISAIVTSTSEAKLGSNCCLLFAFCVF